MLTTSRPGLHHINYSYTIKLQATDMTELHNKKKNEEHLGYQEVKVLVDS